MKVTEKEVQVQELKTPVLFQRKPLIDFSANDEFDEVVDTAADFFVLIHTIETNAVKGNPLMTGLNIALKGTPIIVEIAQDSRQFVSEFSKLPSSQTPSIVTEAMQIAVTRRGSISEKSFTYFVMQLLLQNSMSYDFLVRTFEEGKGQIESYEAVFALLKQEDTENDDVETKAIGVRRKGVDEVTE